METFVSKIINDYRSIDLFQREVTYDKGNINCPDEIDA